ncbi:MAG: YaeQ family protein [Rhodocyclaceae bacterium]|nr:YaeQ family protein [Rhodocyclaceae bacterium]
MALKSTIFKVSVSIADMDRPYYGEHALTLARHPSETDERMMVRLLAFIMFADPRLEFGRGLSAEDEPALWQKDYSGVIERWIEVGLPDERTLKKAAGRAAEVIVLVYGGKAADIWWGKEGRALARLANLRVFALDVEQSAALAALAARGMQLQCTIQDGQIWLTAGDGAQTALIEPRPLNWAQ